MEAATAAIPDPGKLTFDVDVNLYTISGFPAFCTFLKDLYEEVLVLIIEMMDAVSVIPVNTEDQVAAGFSLAKRSTVSLEYV